MVGDQIESNWYYLIKMWGMASCQTYIKYNNNDNNNNDENYNYKRFIVIFNLVLINLMEIHDYNVM